jgi:hypothetical protein
VGLAQSAAAITILVTEISNLSNWTTTERKRKQKLEREIGKWKAFAALLRKARREGKYTQ